MGGSQGKKIPWKIVVNIVADNVTFYLLCNLFSHVYFEGKKIGGKCHDDRFQGDIIDPVCEG